MRNYRTRLRANNSGQSLVETAIMMPLLLALVFNALNFGYFFVIAVNVAATPRSAVLYSIQGSSAPTGTGLPAAGPTSTLLTIANVAYQDMTGALASATSSKVQICTKSLGTNGTGTSTAANCITCTNSTSCGSTGAAGSPAPSADPEAPTFVLNRVDVYYKFKPLIPGTPFNIALMPSSICSSGTCTFHRQVSMRAMD